MLGNLCWEATVCSSRSPPTSRVECRLRMELICQEHILEAITFLKFCHVITDIKPYLYF